MAVERGRNTLIKRDELPKFNGKPISSIYAKYTKSRYFSKEEGGGYGADIMYYDCHVENFGDTEIIRIKELPKEFKDFFGIVENKGQQIFVTNIWIRMSCSGNGSFTDGSVDLDGWHCNATSGSFTLYRDVPYFNGAEAKDNTHVIDENGELGKKFLSVLGKNFKVKEITMGDVDWSGLKEGTLDFATKYPFKHTPIKIIDGMVYRTEKLASWEWLHGMPYRVLDTNLDERGTPNDRSSIRVWDDLKKQHVYLQQVEEVEAGDENLVIVSFDHKQNDVHGNDVYVYCRIRKLRDDLGGDYCRYTIDKVDNDHWPIQFHSEVNGVKSKKQRTFKGMFYRIIRTFESMEHRSAPPIGTIFSTLIKYKTDDSYFQKEIRGHYKVIEDNGREVKLQKLWFYHEGERIDEMYEEPTFMTVDSNWFDQYDTGRIITVMSEGQIIESEHLCN